MKQYKNPKWWTTKNDSAWERTKAAFKRDWDQTKHDLGGDEPDTNQDVDETVKQAVGKEGIPSRGEPTYEDITPAYRFGFGARSYYGKQYWEWNQKLETRLQTDWLSTYPSRTRNWNEDLEYIRRGWDYDETSDATTRR